ncbi:DUF2147 domain-containing protein [Fulvivirgaceae bacterium BMA10]|uniref:DUF2147 domain-containing protein n=1 Tax=Splendidivirga corallicola TaxID=3051826 RepID=A0ABT8KR22_9BACT|nr:DUF2147 domain-containing protein [Fulvivirgaceae bacterium BMA10]
MKNLLILITLAISCISANAQNNIFGKWKTVDDVTGEVKSVVEIYKESGKAYGKIIDITDPEEKDSVCDKCDEDDPRKGKKIMGMIIITGLEQDGKKWDDGKILDPENGKVYSCKIWVEDGKLYVRGYIGISLVGRSQTWLPAQ